MRMTARTAWEEMLFPEDLRVERWEKQRVACLIAKNIMENEISARQKQILVLYYKEKKTMPDIFGVSTDYILGRTKYRTYEGTSFEVPKIIDLLSRGDMEMISNWAELSPENQARIADYAKILQKAEAADKNKK